MGNKLTLKGDNFMERKKVKNRYGIKEGADRSGSQLLGERENGYGQKYDRLVEIRQIESVRTAL